MSKVYPTPWTTDSKEVTTKPTVTHRIELTPQADIKVSNHGCDSWFACMVIVLPTPQYLGTALTDQARKLLIAGARCELDKAKLILDELDK